MKKLIGIMALMAALFIMTSCGGGGNTPKAVAEKAVKCLQDKDYDKFADLVYMKVKEGEDPEAGKKMLSGMMQGKADKMYEKKGGIKSYEALSEQIDESGESAVVKMKIMHGDGSDKEDDIKLKKDEQGNWKIDMGK